MRAVLLPLVGLVLALSACGDDTPASTPTPTTDAATTTQADADPAPPSPWPAPLTTDHQEWTVTVVRRLPHDPGAFTQGLELTDRGLLESTGRRGESTLRLVDPVSGEVLARHDLDPTWFGEGVTAADDEIVQLTWESGVAVRYDPERLQPVGRYEYAGEGWGICADGTGYWTSDGTTRLSRRDPTTFEVVAAVDVARDGVAVDRLNELECIGDHVVANTWKSDEILVIEPTSGAVVATIDASALTAEIAPSDDQAVLNGIADMGDGTLLLGGKLWPTFFVVEVVAVR